MEQWRSMTETSKTVDGFYLGDTVLVFQDVPELPNLQAQIVEILNPDTGFVRVEFIDGSRRNIFDTCLMRI